MWWEYGGKPSSGKVAVSATPCPELVSSSFDVPGRKAMVVMVWALGLGSTCVTSPVRIQHKGATQAGVGCHQAFAGVHGQAVRAAGAEKAERNVSAQLGDAAVRQQGAAPDGNEQKAPLGIRRDAVGLGALLSSTFTRPLACQQ